MYSMISFLFKNSIYVFNLFYKHRKKHINLNADFSLGLSLERQRKELSLLIRLTSKKGDNYW